MESLSPLHKPQERTKAAFLIAMAVAAAMFLPFLIIDKGFFIFYGDFNVQQIPFYQMVHDAIRSGELGWSWTTDLGANLFGSYTFYLLGSPFFWLTLPFPSAVVPYMMAPLLVLKFSFASLSAYGYLRRFVRPDAALMGGLLYAFSGFSVYNIFFNHFHEAIIYFPLMLLGMELNMKDGKRGIFALTVFLSALSNYYFFIGQAIFLIIYWFIRMLSGDWKCTFSKFLGLFFEAVVGTAMAGVLLLPAYYAVIQNPRTNNILGGWDALIYSKPQRLLDILHSYFFPQDIPARASFFKDSDNKWASMSLWLPVFGCSGLIAYVQSRHHTDWLRRMLIICFVCTVIPLLNAMFQLFNSMYYARWFYMFVLLIALATVKTIDEADEVAVNWKRALGWTGGITAAFALTIGLLPISWTPDEKTGKLTFGLYNRDYPELFFIAIAFAAVCLILTALLVSLHRRDRRLFRGWSLGITLAVMLIFGCYSIGAGKVQGNVTSAFVIDRAINKGSSISLPETDGTDTVRVDFNSAMDNMGMFWKMPTIQAFQSIVPGSVMEFYPTIGVDRSVGSRPNTTHYALRGLTSVRWLFDYSNDDNTVYKDDDSFFSKTDDNGIATTAMPGWKYYDTQNGFLIYENQYYVPLGFTYDYYMTRSEYNGLASATRESSLLKALVVEDKDVETVSAILPSFYNTGAYYRADFSQQGYFRDCLDRRASSCSAFSRDARGFSAEISLKKDNLVFFSVPYEKGWSATVNGQAADIVKADVGFMAVLCPAGQDVSIRFDYTTPGLKNGALISLAALGVFLLYLALTMVTDSRRRQRTARLNAQAAAFPQPPAPDQEPATSALPKDVFDFDLYRLYPGAHKENVLPPASGEDNPQPPDKSTSSDLHESASGAAGDESSGAADDSSSIGMENPSNL